ncbi:MAG: hypothetical protein A3J48_04000 [Candidatus Doudnabacteria bacterium RIFCSPHIGHO2_02_FULL_46_11]|uniref:Glycerate kinase n=1 Tax=Candidatus Doudnabacteria bacterium RIFCSPHIGHO2_02_FULL_46_11 TaxID=1817832 RepID=A0A1F5P8M4_9BACT|nr:MAG: hypothetical protein A3J48_04000 [Candidatus Doudnabacteria bacterium RIFCSPHIGHO2_02_FULL_46_11]
MARQWIKNWDQIARSPARQDILKIAEVGLRAVDTSEAIKNNIGLDGDILSVKGQTFDLKQFDSLKIVALGKASAEAAAALEEILGSRISQGVSLGITVSPSCQIIKNYKGSHPHPSSLNVEASGEIKKLAESASENDLVLVVVSGGGSALLCWPQSECDQGQELYNKFLTGGGTIDELNTVRKHISLLKGGGLAKALYPATVISLILSDIPGDKYELVASGPTFFDESTVEDAKKIITKYGLGDFELIETPKEKKYFEKVSNIPFISNTLALNAMAKEAAAQGFKPLIISSEMYDPQDKAIEKIFEAAGKKTAILAGGETALKITRSGGTGGRNMNLSMYAIKHLQEGDVFLSLASDGMDNSDSAGALVDMETKEKSSNLNFNDYQKRFDCYTFFEKTHDLLFTGPTGANVSDLMILLRS